MDNKKIASELVKLAKELVSEYDANNVIKNGSEMGWKHRQGGNYPIVEKKGKYGQMKITIAPDDKGGVIFLASYKGKYLEKYDTLESAQNKLEAYDIEQKPPEKIRIIKPVVEKFQIEQEIEYLTRDIAHSKKILSEYDYQDRQTAEYEMKKMYLKRNIAKLKELKSILWE